MQSKLKSILFEYFAQMHYSLYLFNILNESHDTVNTLLYDGSRQRWQLHYSWNTILL